MKKLAALLLTAALLTFGAASAAAQTPTAPKSVIHVVTVAWKAGTTPEQIKAAVDGVQALPSQFKGLLHVWTNAIKIQDAPGAKVSKSNVFVMEFADADAFKAYDKSPAQAEWYKVYLPIREQSTTFDITN